MKAMRAVHIMVVSFTLNGFLIGLLLSTWIGDRGHVPFAAPCALGIAFGLAGHRFLVRRRVWLA